MSLNYSGTSLNFAKKLRKNMTRHERHLWYDFLSTYKPRFQRQKTIGKYIVDFYCHTAKLAIELDGSQHYEELGISADLKRTDELEKYGIRIIRFSNLDIDRHFKNVCEEIDLQVKGLKQ